ARAYQDSDPIKLAWLYVQRGRHELQASDSQAAATYLRTALTIWPHYVAASEELGIALRRLHRFDEAVDVHQRALGVSHSPQLMAGLAAAHREAGRPAEAERWSSRAKSGIEDFLSEFPEAAYREAALFYLADGGDPRRALALSQADVALRPDSAGL